MQDYEDMLVDVVVYTQLEADIDELEYDILYLSDCFTEEELQVARRVLSQLKACV